MRKKLKFIFSGVLISATIALVAIDLSDVFGVPSILLALIAGLCLSKFANNEILKPGLNFSSTSILQIGVALLGIRISFSDVMTLGLETILMLVFAISSTIFLGIVLSKPLGVRRQMGALSGGATAICGASATMALASAMPNSRDKEQNTVIAIIGVTALSSVAMVLYPIVSHYLNLNDSQAGIFFGASIHNVPQVVGAGYIVSENAADVATLTKLIRISFLLPVVFLFMAIFNARGQRHKNKALSQKARIPKFLIAFFILMTLNQIIAIPFEIKSVLNDTAKFFLLMAMAAIGIKSHLRQLLKLCARPLILMVIETLWLAGVVLGFIFFV